MLKIVNNKIYIVRGDDEVLAPEICYSGGGAYAMQADDVLTLTVRALPRADSPVLLSVSSEPGSRSIALHHQDTAGLDYGAYSADIQLTFGDGRRATIWPTDLGSGRIRGRNLKNFNVASEVTI